MRNAVRPGLFAVVIACGLLGFRHADDATVCSLEISHAPGAGGTYLLAAATPDTIAARAGQAAWTFAPGAAARRIAAADVYGQIVRVEGIGGATSGEIGRALEASRGEAVLVPWDFAPDCTPLPWSRSSRWSTPGLVGLYSVRPRQSEHWAGGRPTFDVPHARFHPYPHAADLRHQRRPASADSYITAEQLFELVQSLPTAEQVQRNPGDTARIGQWLQQHPELVTKYPVPTIINRLFADAEQLRVASLIPPMRGTYRLTISPAGESPLTLFLRTEDHPARAIMPPPGRDPIASAPRTRSERYQLDVFAAMSEDGLPLSFAEATATSCGAGVITVAENPTRADGAEVWSAELDEGMIQRCFSQNAQVQLVIQQLRQMRRSRAYPRMPGVFRRQPDGRITFEQVLSQTAGAVLVIRGERISDRVGVRRR